MDVKDSYLHGTIGVVKSISVNADKLTYTLADINQTSTTVTLPVATQSANGLLSSADKIKLDKSTGINQSIPYIVGPDTDTTAGTWTGTYSGITEYTDGLTIIYVPKVAGASTTTLNINNIGSKVCYYSGSSKLTTHYPAGTPILLTYSGGYWKRADYYYDSSQLRVYRQTTGYDADYPILVSRTLASSIGTAGTDGSYGNVYSLIGDDSTKIPTINPLTGEIKAPKFTGTFNGTANSVANSLILKIKSGSTEGTSLYTYNGSSDKTLDIKQGNNVTLTATEGELTIAASDNKVTQTDNNDASYLRVLLSSTANNETYTGSVKKSSKLYFNPSSGTLQTTKFKGSWEFDSDSKSTATIPSNYKAAFKFVGIKTPSAIGLTTTVAGSYVSLFGWKGYTDNSGPHSWELASGNTQRIYVRSGVGIQNNGVGNEDWNDWHTLAYTSDIPTKVSQLTNDSGYLTKIKKGLLYGLVAQLQLREQTIQKYTYVKTPIKNSGSDINNGMNFIEFNIYEQKTNPTQTGVSKIILKWYGFDNQLSSYFRSSWGVVGEFVSNIYIALDSDNYYYIVFDHVFNKNAIINIPYFSSGFNRTSDDSEGWSIGTCEDLNYFTIYKPSTLEKSISSGYIVSGGTSSQFLKADGTLDNNTYVTGGPYLPLSGGVMDTNSYISWTSINNPYSNSVADWSTVTGNGIRVFSSTTTDSGAPTTFCTALHVKGPYGFQLVGQGGSVNSFFIRNIALSLWNTLIHSNNYNSYSPKLDGTGATGNWGINITGSAGKLTTPRTIWGQSFDGSTDISGNMTGVGSISMSKALTLTGIAQDTAVINFSRSTDVASYGYNYIHCPKNGDIAITPGVDNSSTTGYHFTSTDLRPGVTNTYSLGTASLLWKEIHATTLKGNLDWSYIQNKPTSLPANGGNADTVDGKHASDFLPITGGTLTGWLKFDNEQGILQINGRYKENGGGWTANTIYSKGPNNELIYNLGCFGYNSSIHYVYLGCNTYTGVNFRIYPDRVAYGTNTILHEGNYTDYINTTNFPGLNKTGTVTSIGLSVPTGFSVSSSPITTSGTLGISFASGYSLPTTAKQTNWDTVYNWYTGITADDTDALVNKWGEIVDFLDSVAEGTDITDEFVTRKTNQEITGAKTFTGTLSIKSPTYNKITQIYSIDENSNCRTIIKGSNFTHSLMLYDSFTSSGLNYATLSGGYTNDAALTLRSYTCDTVNNTASLKGITVISTGASAFADQVTARKFITRNGTSSQFVKGNGDLDSTTYATMTQLDDLQNQLSALSAGIKVAASLSVSTIYKNTATSVKITGTTKDNAGNITASEIVIKEGSTVLATANNVATTSHTKSVTTSSSSTVFTVTAIAQGLPLSTTVTLYARYPVMYGMGTSAENVYNNGSKASARTSAVSTSTYNATASANNVRFYLLVPSDVTKPTSFTMGGAPVDMVIPTATTTIGGIAYYVFYTNAIYNSGAAVQIKAN